MLRQTCDVAVVGAGPAGIAAAAAAARNGLHTVLLERLDQVGGLVHRGRFTTICGLYRNGSKTEPVLLNLGFPEEFSRRLMAEDSLAGPVRMGRVHVLRFRSGLFEIVARRFLAEEKDLDLRLSAAVVGVSTGENRVREIRIVQKERQYRLIAGAVIDATGNAHICEMAGAGIFQADARMQVPAVLAELKNTGRFFCSRSGPIWLLAKIKTAVDEGILHQDLATLSFMPGVGEGEVVVKINLGESMQKIETVRNTDPAGEAVQLRDQLIDFLQTRVAGLEDVLAADQPLQVLHRAGNRVQGHYCLTRQDVLTGARFADAVARGAWPIETYHSRKGPCFTYLPDDTAYEIPARSLRAKGLDNLFAAGKSICADEEAIASARVVGCCLATGAAAGKLAAHTAGC